MEEGESNRRVNKMLEESLTCRVCADSLMACRQLSMSCKNVWKPLLVASEFTSMAVFALGQKCSRRWHWAQSVAG